MFLIQSISDLVVTTSLTLYAILLNSFLTSSTLPEHVVITIYFFFWYSMFLSVSMLLLITTERFLAITFPFHHHTHISINKILIAVIFTFLLSSVPAIVYVTYIRPSPDSLLDKYYFITIGSISLGIIITIYSLLLISYRTIKKSINQRIHHIEANTSTTDEHTTQIIIQEQKKNLRIFTILITVSWFNICYLFSVNDSI